MFVLDIDVKKLRETDRGRVSIHIEKKKGAGWTRDRTIDLTPDTPEAQRKMIVANDERLVFEGNIETAIVFDKAQNAAVPAPVVKIPASIEPQVASMEPTAEQMREEAVAKAAAAAKAAIKPPAPAPAPAPAAKTPVTPNKEA